MMVIVVGKPNYYFLLKKRKQKLADVLDRNEVTTKKEFNNFCKSLDKEFLLTEDFFKEAERYLKGLADSKTKSKVIPTTKVENPTPENPKTEEKKSVPSKDEKEEDKHTEDKKPVAKTKPSTTKTKITRKRKPSKKRSNSTNKKED